MVSAKRAAKTSQGEQVEDQLVVELDRAEDVLAGRRGSVGIRPAALKRPSTISAAITIVTNISAVIRSAKAVP